MLSPAKWIDFRPYAGLILTKMNKDNIEIVQAGSRSTAKAVLLGGKSHITAPIPWVAPYVEIGLGASIGSFETVTPYTQVDESGIFLQFLSLWDWNWAPSTMSISNSPIIFKTG